MLHSTFDQKMLWGYSKLKKCPDYSIRKLIMFAAECMKCQMLLYPEIDIITRSKVASKGHSSSVTCLFTCNGEHYPASEVSYIMFSVVFERVLYSLRKKLH